MEYVLFAIYNQMLQWKKKKETFLEESPNLTLYRRDDFRFHRGQTPEKKLDPILRKTHFSSIHRRTTYRPIIKHHVQANSERRERFHYIEMLMKSLSSL